MIALHDYECTRCGEWTEHLVDSDRRMMGFRCMCGGRAEWRPSAPHLHTSGTFARDIGDPIVKRTLSGDGSYIDPNLSHNKDGTWTPIRSPKHREELMRAKGLYAIEPDDMCREVDRDKRRQAKSFSATGTRG